MRRAHAWRLFLKSGILISVVIFVGFSCLQNYPSSQLTSPEIGALRNEIQLQPLDHEGEGHSPPKPSDLHWSDFNKNVKFHQRFWDLVKAGKSSNHTLTTEPLFKNKMEYLWRPLKGQIQLDGSESNRLVPQIVWEMEAQNSYTFKNKKIVLWDSFNWWNKRDWVDPKVLKSSECEIAQNSLTQCIFTENKNDLSSGDAVIATRDMFHTGEVNVPENVLKFYFILESPFHSWALLDRDKDLFATYWRGSDIVTPYAKWVYYDLKNQTIPTEHDYAEGKSKVAAAFISNCDPWNDRLGFIKELKEHIQVDVYGSCGDHSCSKASNQDCFGMIKKDYYFYMSFENSNCRDYITEKLFTNALTNDIVPVVMGAHPEDYKAMAPYKSYIHIEDFQTPKELANYLDFLMKNPAEYNKYFEWKKTGEFVSASFFCQLCAMVHYADIVPPPKREHPYRWGHVQAVKSGMCLPKGQWYWTRNNDGSTNPTKKTKKDDSNPSDSDLKPLYGAKLFFTSQD